MTDAANAEKHAKQWRWNMQTKNVNIITLCPAKRLHVTLVLEQPKRERHFLSGTPVACSLFAACNEKHKPSCHLKMQLIKTKPTRKRVNRRKTA
jgi:hypothetical protein